MTYYPHSPQTGARYKLVSPDGVTAIFNDPADPYYVGMLTEVTGLDSAEVRESASEVVEGDGGVHGNFYFGRRPIVLNGRVFNHTTISERTARLDLASRASLAMRGDSILSWKPSSRSENLITNPRAQSNTTDWVVSGANTGVSSGAALTRQTGVAPAVGTTGLQIVTSGAGNANQGAAIPVFLSAGVTYAVSVSYRRTAGTAAGEVVLTNASGATSTLLGSLTSASFVTVAGTFVPTATGVHYLAFRSPTSNSSAATFQFADVMVRPGSNATYVDGDSFGFYWNGDVGNSASGDFIEMFTTVRRQQPVRVTGGWVKDFQIPMVSEYAVLFGTGLKTAAMGTVAENRGNYPAYPVIAITGASGSPTVSDGTRVFRTTGLTLAGGETLEIDTLTHQATFTAGARVGQSGNRYVDWTNTAWPYLAGNGTTQTFSLTGGGSASIRYRDTWA